MKKVRWILMLIVISCLVLSCAPVSEEIRTPAKEDLQVLFYHREIPFSSVGALARADEENTNE